MLREESVFQNQRLSSAKAEKVIIDSGSNPSHWGYQFIEQLTSLISPCR